MAEFKPNKSQEEFINSKEKSVLVSASAGSGKTSTMIQKILHLLISTKTPITNFMVVTYTNAAASEIKQKLYNAITDKISKVESFEDKNYLKNELDNLNNAEIGTLHAICKKLIVKYFYEVGQSPDFKLLNEKESGYLFESAIDKVFKTHIVADDPKFFELYDCYNSKRSDENLKTIIIKLKNFIDSKADFITWKNEFLNSSYSEDLNSNLACDTILKYHTFRISSLRPQINKLLEQRQLLGLDKYTTFLQNRFHFIDAFCKSANFEQSVKIADNFVTDRKPPKTKTMTAEELEFDAEVADFAGDFKLMLDAFKKSVVTTDIEEIKLSLNRAKKNLLKILEISDEIRNEYQTLKANQNALDFNDLENIMQQLLDNDNIRDTLSNTYKYIFVDEYQDINEKQENILNNLLKDNQYFMIGDVKQSIYAFRQSSPKIFISKYADYSSDGKINRVINFNVNYRSEKNILEFANLVFDSLITPETIGVDYKKNARFESEKDLHSDRVNFNIINVSEGTEDKEEAEALLVADNISKILMKTKEDGTKFEYRDIAIIVRSRGTFVKTLCDTLSSLQIPLTAQVKNDFYKTSEIQLMINILKCISNFKNDVAITSVLKNLMELNEEELISVSNSSTEKYFYDKVLNYSAEDGIKVKLNHFFDFINRYTNTLTYKTIYATLCEIIDEYNLMLKIKSLPNGIERVDNIKEFLAITDNENYEYSLDKFIEYLDFASKEDSLQTIGNTGNCVQVCTIHHSKGLEYPAVIIAGMGRKFQTNKDSSEIIINSTYGVGLKSIDSENRTISETVVRNACKIDNLKSEIDEEIRLLYVAMTRAREYLYMVGTMNLKVLPVLHKMDLYNCSSYMEMILKSIDKCYYSHFANKKEFVIYEDTPMVANVTITPLGEIVLKDTENETQIILDAIDNSLLDKLKQIKLQKPNNETFTIKNTVTNILTEEKDYENLNFNPIKLDVSDSVESIDSLKLGTAYHLVMQYVNFNEGREDIVNLISGLVEANMLDAEIANLVNPDKIISCINILKPLIIKAKNIYKEKQFLLQENYNKLVKNSDNNTKVIVQGIIDTVLIFEDGAYLIDYKTNKTSNEDFLKNHYQLQLKIYKIAFERATNIKITKKFLYSFHLDKLIEVE